jgi:hypothetical protein
MTHLLEQKFTGKGEVSGFLFEQVYKNKWYYVYRVSHEGRKWFEAIKRVTVPVCLDFAQKIYSTTEFKEVYPKANQFGVSAFCCSTYPKALAKGFKFVDVVEACQ